MSVFCMTCRCVVRGIRIIGEVVVFSFGEGADSIVMLVGPGVLLIVEENAQQDQFIPRK